MLPVSDVWLCRSVRHVLNLPIADSILTVPAIFVGPARQWIPELIERAQNLKVSGGFEEGTDLYAIPGREMAEPELSAP